MLRLTTTLLLLAGSAAIAASAPVLPDALPLDVRLKEAKQEAAAAGAEQRRLENAAADARDEVSRLRARQLAAAQAIAAAEAEITAADAAARIATARLAAQRQRLERERAPVSALLGGLVLSARRPPLLLLADPGSVDELVKLRILLSATIPVIRSRTAALADELERSTRLQLAASEARSGLEQRKSELDRRRVAFAALEERAAEVARERGSRALGAGDVALALGERVDIAEQSASSQREAIRLANELAGLGPAPLRPAGGAVQSPLRYRLPADAPVTDGLGAVSDSGVRSRGITLATHRGAPVTVPAGGRILYAGPFRDYDGVIIIDHGGGWKSVLVNAGTRLPKGAAVRIGEPLGIALGPLEVQLQRDGEMVSPALIAGSYGILSNKPKGG